MLAPARNDDPGSSDHATLDDAAKIQPGLPRDDEYELSRGVEMRPVAERLRHALKQGGVPQLLRRSLNHVASPWLEFGSVTFFRRRLDVGPEVPRSRPGLSVYQASLDDIKMVLSASDPH